MTRAYIGIGSNLQQPIQQVQQAIAAMSQLPSTRLLSCSRLYRSAPMGPQDQPDYINAVAEIDTTLTPLELLDALHVIERTQGRVRDGSRWGPRTLDLDILLFGAECINFPQLTIPHPGLHERNFVLYPLQEIAPALVIPGQGELATLVANCPASGLEPIDDI
ncbi:MAG: 2-amino-4-hydroxy-6-hydroxymethyldihydropteridine diphosphokinase [Gammaproteobacteria bacterium]|nr:2-amino-4-hydroxy-6-hydroxymethyldihydropteridine diphosphokinase [Gammaproteobacteria bacterium]